METFEKKYNDALERAKQGLPMDEVFPELKESDDERIRKWLIEMVKELRKANPTDAEHNGNCSKALAYLEKQKEQKPEGIDEYEIIKKHITEDSLSSEVNKRLKECGWYVTYEKPVEWSEEDKEMLEKCISKMANIIPAPGKHGLEDMSFEKHTDEELVIWFKSLPKRFNLPLKQEWSEEDKNFIKELCDLLASIAKNNYVGRYYAPDLISKLQSLRPQPHWKPSEEQIAALEWQIKNTYDGSWQKKESESLLTELKKL